MKNYFKFTCTLLLCFQVFAITNFETNSSSGKNKYQRIGIIENYLKNFSKEFNTNLSGDLTEIKKKVEVLEKRESKENLSKDLKEIKKELKELKKALELKHKKDIDLLKDLVLKLNKEQNENRELVTESILKKVLYLNRIISGFGKLPGRKNSTKKLSP